MDDKLIEKIIYEIDQHQNEIQRIIPYLNNEPSLDKRMLDILRRLKLKNHFVELSTNMSGFTSKVSDAIVSERLVDELRISLFGGNCDDYHKIMPNLCYDDIISKIEYLISINRDNQNLIDIKIVIILYPEIDMKNTVSEIEKHFPDIEVFTFGFLDRASNLENLKNKKVLEDEESKDFILQGCDLNRPFERVCILSNGKVILCSQDWDREVELGNVSHQNIFDIWNGELFEKERCRIVGKTFSPPNYICRRCKLVRIRRDGSDDVVMNFLGDAYMDKEDHVLLNV
ncbi:MAG: SPASM domain-containing protein [Bacteroidales bacterium]|nr:SPASM domain-containing protein [Bacteroidales bacterium]